VSPLPPTLAASRLVRLHGPDPLTRMSWNGALAICRKTGWERRGNGTVNATPTDRKTVDRLRYSVRNSGKNARSLTQIRSTNTSVEIAKAVQLRLIAEAPTCF
jgi:hypothetical protein